MGRDCLAITFIIKYLKCNCNQMWNWFNENVADTLFYVFLGGGSTVIAGWFFKLLLENYSLTTSGITGGANSAKTLLEKQTQLYADLARTLSTNAETLRAVVENDKEALELFKQAFALYAKNPNDPNLKAALAAVTKYLETTSETRQSLIDTAAQSNQITENVRLDYWRLTHLQSIVDAVTTTAPDSPAGPALGFIFFMCVFGGSRKSFWNLTARTQYHVFHILPPSPFPLVLGQVLFLVLLSMIYYTVGICIYNKLVLITAFSTLAFVMLRWFLSVVFESAAGHHTVEVQTGLRLGMLLFIASEVMFFFAFFWGFFNYSLGIMPDGGVTWPPIGTQALDLFGLPLVNTCLLLWSGVTVTAGHHALITGNTSLSERGLFCTVFLGVTFLLCQFYEYRNGVDFGWRSNIFGSIFFITTGFHGLHVTIGTIFLLVCWARLLPKAHKVANSPVHLSRPHHFGAEAAAWYWHFVDVVWLFLFLVVYAWGGAIIESPGVTSVPDIDEELLRTAMGAMRVIAETWPAQENFYLTWQALTAALDLFTIAVVGFIENLTQLFELRWS